MPGTRRSHPIPQARGWAQSREAWSGGSSSQQSPPECLDPPEGWVGATSRGQGWGCSKRPNVLKHTETGAQGPCDRQHMWPQPMPWPPGRRDPGTGRDKRGGGLGGKRCFCLGWGPPCVTPTTALVPTSLGDQPPAVDPDLEESPESIYRFSAVLSGVCVRDEHVGHANIPNKHVCFSRELTPDKDKQGVSDPCTGLPPPTPSPLPVPRLPPRKSLSAGNLSAGLEALGLRSPAVAATGPGGGDREGPFFLTQWNSAWTLPVPEAAAEHWSLFRLIQVNLGTLGSRLGSMEPQARMAQGWEPGRRGWGLSLWPVSGRRGQGCRQRPGAPALLGCYMEPRHVWSGRGTVAL